MRSLSILICLLSISVTAFSQKSVVSADKMNVLYIGVPNPITIMAEGYSCAQTSVEAEGCTFTHKEGCSYEVMVTKPGSVLVKVKAGGKFVGQHQFRAKYIPDPVAYIGGKTGGKMLVAMFKAQLGIIARPDNFEIDARAKVLSFRMTVSRNRTIIYDAENKGGGFQEPARDFIDTVKPGDIIVFSEIKADWFGLVRTINSIELELI